MYDLPKLGLTVELDGECIQPHNDHYHNADPHSDIDVRMPIVYDQTGGGNL